MALSRDEIAALQAAFRADASAAAFVDAQERLLVLDGEGRRILHAGARAEPFAAAVAGPEGDVDPASPVAERLHRLARGLAPRRGGRLERLPVSAEASTALVCRTAALGSRDLLVCALLEPIALPQPPQPHGPLEEPVGEGAHPEELSLREASPQEPSQEEPSPQEPSQDEPSEEPLPEEPFLPFVAGVEPSALEDAGPREEAVPEPVVPAPAVDEPVAILDRVRAKGVVRFLWQADPETRFLSVSDSLAATLGDEAADVVGSTWADLAGGRVEDPSGIVADVLARRETWSGRTVWWRIDDRHAAPVDLAGMPVLDRTRGLVGYRGFGLIRADAAEIRPLPAPPPSAEQTSAEPDADDAASLGADGAVPADDTEPEVGQEAAADDTAAWAGEPASAADDEPVDEGFEEARLAAEPIPGPGDVDLHEQDEQDASEEDGEEADFRAAADQDAEMRAALPFDETDVEAVASGDDALDLLPPPSRERAPSEDVPSEDTHAEDAHSEGGYAEDTHSEDAPREEGPVETSPAAEMSARGEPVNSSPSESSFALSGTVRARFGEGAPPPLRVVETGLAADGPPPAGGPRATVPRLTMSERSAFREIAKALGARFEEDEPVPPAEEPAPLAAEASDISEPVEPVPPPAADPEPGDFARLLERLPAGVLIHRGDVPLLVNRALREMTGYDSLEDLVRAGGLPRIFHGRSGALARAEHDVASPMALGTRGGESVPAEIRLTTVEWGGAPASLMLIRRVPDADPGLKLRALELDLRSRDARLRELSAILDTATDGVIVLDDVGRILSLNRSAEALFGYDQNEVTGESVTILLSPDSHAVALDYLEGLRSNGVASLLNDGREVTGRVRQGGAIPLFMTMGKVAEGPGPKYCAVLRDITAFKKAEGELIAAKRAAEQASAQKSDFLAKISHEIRTPLNAIIGFAEVMLEERFGAVGSERYRDYLRDIHGSGEHVISLVNDLLDLAKVEAGRMELSFTGVGLNDLVTNCVALLQPQASRDRIVMRTSFAAKLPPVVADERSLRQIVLNLVSNAIKFTDAGGQVIVSTAMTDRGEVAFRVRDTGIGMSEPEIEAALEPFRQLATARKGGGTGLGLPLTKALVEANRGALQISSAKGEGTLVEVLFPPTRVLAE